MVVVIGTLRMTFRRNLGSAFFGKFQSKEIQQGGLALVFAVGLQNF